MGERASNLFGVLLSLTVFSVLLAVMLVAVSVLPDIPNLTSPTLPGEPRESRPVRTPQPVTLGELALTPVPALQPEGAAVASVTFATSLVPPPTGVEGPGAPPLVGGPTRPGSGPGGGIRGPAKTTPDTPGKSLGHVKKKGESGHPERGRGFLKCDEGSHPGKGRAKGQCDGPGNKVGKSGGGKGRGKKGSSGGVTVGGGSDEIRSSGGGRGLGHVKAKGNGHGRGHGKGHSRHHG